MPIYAYRCSSCGHGADVMQKMSDAPLTVCTACGKPTFSKQITAAGFQLKGSGWYATDFKNSSKGTKAGNTDKPAEKSGDSSGSDTKSDTTSDSKTDTKPAAHACGSGGCGTCS